MKLSEKLRRLDEFSDALEGCYSDAGEFCSLVQMADEAAALEARIDELEANVKTR